MEIMLRKLPNDYKLKKEYLDKNSKNIEVLFFGNSHSYYGFNPFFFSANTFNASYISQHLDVDYQILLKYQNHFDRLKTIIMPISYFTLYGNMKEGKDSWRLKNYVIYYQLDIPNSISYCSEVLGNKMSVNFRRVYSYYIKNSPSITCSPLGWGTSYHSGKSGDLAETGKLAAMRHTRTDIHSSKYTTIFKENVDILNSIIQWCKNKNIELIFITTPTHLSYRNHLNKEQLSNTINTITKLADENANVQYFNMINDTNFVDEDYFDADHLNEIGAKKLSIIANSLITKLN